jgi:hypothetical protein
MKAPRITRKRYTESIRREGLAMVLAFSKVGIVFPTHNAFEAVRLARRYNKIQEDRCNGEMSSMKEAEEENTETKILNIVQPHGVSATFGGDPRGYSVKLHAPTQDVYNTLGGKEEGYGIGEEA